MHGEVITENQRHHSLGDLIDKSFLGVAHSPETEGESNLNYGTLDFVMNVA